MRKKHKKESKMPGLILVLFIGAVLALPAGILSYIFYFAWDNQQSGEFYKPAIERDGKLYELNLSGNALAFDEGTNDASLYLNSPYNLGELIAIFYADYKTNETENPFFAGKITFAKNNYQEMTTKYRTPQETFQNYKFYDRERRLIFEYEPEMQSPYVIKLRPTFPAFSKSKVSIGNKRDYINATKLLKEKLGANLKVRADETNKLLILRFD